MQSHVDCSFAAGAAGNEGVDIFLCLFLTAVSSGLLSIVSSLLGMTALVSMFLIPMKSALILLVSAWLISPAGLPLIAQKLLEVLYAGCERMQDWVMG